MTFWLALVALALGDASDPDEHSVPSALAEPSAHTLIYYNARMALREGDALEAVKLWMLRNALEEQTATLSQHDADFGSVTWAALGELGVCQDGHPTDEDGAGLWPLALHNWVVRNMSRRAAPKPPRTFDAFSLGRQHRLFSINDTLSARELGTMSLFRGGCLRPQYALVVAGEAPNAELSDRQVAGRLLRDLLQRSRDTLAGDRVRGQAVVEARLFDVNLQLAALAAREARQDTRKMAADGRLIGLSTEGISAMREEAPTHSFAPDSEPARILRAAVDWPTSEWMALAPDRRLFLFDHARDYGGEPEALESIALGVLDALIAAGDGEGVEQWLARVEVGEDEQAAASPGIWGGQRGSALLALDPESGFSERSVIALHRGVGQLERGAMPDALRSLAYAMQHASESQASEDVQSLSRRWIAYIASQFEITDALLVTLQQLVPRRDYAALLEDMMWSAALRADARSFDRGVRNQDGRGALSRRADLLAPLAAGNVYGFSRQIRDGLAASPSETLRFLELLLERLEREDAGVRAAHLPTLAAVRTLLSPLTDEKGRPGRVATELLDQAQAITEGLGGLELDASDADRARSLAPTGEVYAGSLRLAPADPLPWPFRASRAPAPSVFTPMTLTPEEWRGDDGQWVFGWSIGG